MVLLGLDYGICRTIRVCSWGNSLRDLLPLSFHRIEVEIEPIYGEFAILYCLDTLAKKLELSAVKIADGKGR